MADFKFPQDGNPNGKEDLRVDLVIDFPPNRLGAGSRISFEVQLIDVTVLDAGVSFKFFSGLSASGFAGSNVEEVIECIELTGLAGTLTFLREIFNSANDFFRIVLAGTVPASTASFLIKARSIT